MRRSFFPDLEEEEPESFFKVLPLLALALALAFMPAGCAGAAHAGPIAGVASSK